MRSILLERATCTDEHYNQVKDEIPFSDDLWDSTEDVPGHCVSTSIICPTKEFEDDFHSDLPLLMFLAVAAAFRFMILTFLAYNRFGQNSNQKQWKRTRNSQVRKGLCLTYLVTRLVSLVSLPTRQMV
jgi:hypothetical protein